MKFATHDLKTSEGKTGAIKITRDLVGWLNTLPNCSNATPVVVSIGLMTYIGARYTIKHSTGKTRESIRYYLLGDLPRSYVNRRNTAYRCENVHQDYDLYVGGYVTKEETIQNPIFADKHPFGVWFGLHIWDHNALEFRVDTYEPCRYPRMNIRIHDLS